MRRVSLKALVVIIGALAVWGVLLYVAANSHATVTGMERHMNKSMTDLQERDCYIKAVTSDKTIVTGYGPSSYCMSLEIGDKVQIENGIVTKK